jgi:hypothetical protein
MTFEGDGSTRVPPHQRITHYHGDGVRILFVISAVIILVSHSVGLVSSFSSIGAVVAAALLIIAAGITSPAQKWIHWVNALFALTGTLIFGVAALEHYRLGTEFLNPSFIVIEILSLLSLAALYLTTKTVRAFYLNIFF